MMPGVPAENVNDNVVELSFEMFNGAVDKQLLMGLHPSNVCMGLTLALATLIATVKTFGCWQEEEEPIVILYNEVNKLLQALEEGQT